MNDAPQVLPFGTRQQRRRAARSQPSPPAAPAPAPLPDAPLAALLATLAAIAEGIGRLAVGVAQCEQRLTLLEARGAMVPEGVAVLLRGNQVQAESMALLHDQVRNLAGAVTTLLERATIEVEGPAGPAAPGPKGRA